MVDVQVVGGLLLRYVGLVILISPLEYIHTYIHELSNALFVMLTSLRFSSLLEEMDPLI